MSENKKNIVQTTVRFPVDLHAQLLDFVHDLGRGKHPRERPSIDTTICNAVRALISGESTALTVGVNRGLPLCKIEHPDDTIFGNGEVLKIESEEIPWAIALLRVLRSRKPGLAEAIRMNLMQFTDAEALYERTIGRDEPKAADDQSREVGEVSERGVDVDRVAAEAQALVDRIRESQESVGRGKKRNPGRTGGRS